MIKKIMVVGSEKGVQRPKPRMRLSGLWLNEIGFTDNSLATAEYEAGKMTIKLKGSGLDTYSQVVRGVIAAKAGLLQVKPAPFNKIHTPHLEIKGYWLEGWGFAIGSVFVVKAEYGLINISLMELEPAQVMTSKIMVVGREIPRQPSSPRLRLTGYWLDAAGFTYDRLAAVEYQPGRITINLQDLRIDCSRPGLVIAAKAGLLRVKPTYCNKNVTSHIEIKGAWLEDFGFKVGSTFVVKAGYGLINIYLIDLEQL